MLTRVFKAFQYPDFRLMWLGACTSSVGTWMQALAQSWLVYRLSNNSVYLGLDAFFAQIPIFLFSLFGGVFADRANRRTILLISQCIQMGSAFTMTVLVLTGSVRVWQIWCLSFTVGLAQSFGGPAYSALVPSLVPREDLQNAIALNSIQFNLARVLGPALGGVALVKLGAPWCFGLNGLSYLAVIASLLAIKPSYQPPKSTDSVLASMREGMHFLRARNELIRLTAIAFFVTLLSYPFITFLPVIARDVFHGSEQTFTLFLSLSGIGSVAGALLVAAAGKRLGTGLYALLAMLLMGMAVASIGLSRSLPLTAGIILVCSLLFMVVFAVNSSLVQSSTPDSMRGRVMSVYNVAFRGGMPFGSLISGLLIKRTSAPAIMTINGVLVVICAVYFLVRSLKWKRT